MVKRTAMLKRYRTMRGGAFTQKELQQLGNIGFTEYQIESLTDLGVSFNEVMQKVDMMMNQGPSGFHDNSDDMTERVLTELLNEHIFENQNNPDRRGGKRRRRTNKKRHTKNKKTRKYRRYKLTGGTCFGTGVGANNYDPNLSIYNTNMLKLFPYKPN